MGWMFYNCDMVPSLDVSNFDTSKVTNMQGMFHSCNSLTSLDVSNFDTSKVTNMQHMFGSDWAKGSSLQSIDISNFNMENVTANDGMFNNCHHLNKVTVNDTATASKIIPYLPNKNEWDHIAGTLVYYDIDPVLIDTPTLQAKNWNLSYEPILAKYIFDNTVNENFLPSFNTEYLHVNYKVIDDVKADGRVVRTLKYANDKRPTWIYFGHGGDDAVHKRGQQCLLSMLYLDINTNIMSMLTTFGSCYNLKYVNTRNWNTSNVEDFSSAFLRCRSLTSLDASNFNTSKATRMNNMFNRCNNLTSLDVSNWNTGKLTDARYLFGYCEALTELDLHTWNVISLTDISRMFFNCINLESLDISNFNMENLITAENALYYTLKLKTINVSNCSTEFINRIMVASLHSRVNDSYGKLYILNNKEHDLIDKATLDAKNWKAVIYGGNIKAVHIPEGMFNSLGLGNVLLKHIHIGERFL